MFREMRRFKQALEPARCEELLREVKRAELAVIGNEGYPYTLPVNFVYQNGKIYIHSAKAGHKVDAILRCPKVSCSLYRQTEQDDDGWSWFIESVIVFGQASFVEDCQTKLDALAALGRKYFPTEEMVRQELDKNADRCALIEITPEHISGKRVHEK